METDLLFLCVVEQGWETRSWGRFRSPEHVLKSSGFKHDSLCNLNPSFIICLQPTWDGSQICQISQLLILVFKQTSGEQDVRLHAVYTCTCIHAVHAHSTCSTVHAQRLSQQECELPYTAWKEFDPHLWLRGNCSDNRCNTIVLSCSLLPSNCRQGSFPASNCLFLTVERNLSTLRMSSGDGDL